MNKKYDYLEWHLFGSRPEDYKTFEEFEAMNQKEVSKIGRWKKQIVEILQSISKFFPFFLIGPFQRRRDQQGTSEKTFDH